MIVQSDPQSQKAGRYSSRVSWKDTTTLLCSLRRQLVTTCNFAMFVHGQATLGQKTALYLSCQPQAHARACTISSSHLGKHQGGGDWGTHRRATGVGSSSALGSASVARVAAGSPFQASSSRPTCAMLMWRARSSSCTPQASRAHTKALAMAGSGSGFFMSDKSPETRSRASNGRF